MLSRPENTFIIRFVSAITTLSVNVGPRICNICMNTAVLFLRSLRLERALCVQHLWCKTTRLSDSPATWAHAITCPFRRSLQPIIWLCVSLGCICCAFWCLCATRARVFLRPRVVSLPSAIRTRHHRHPRTTWQHRRETIKSTCVCGPRARARNDAKLILLLLCAWSGRRELETCPFTHTYTRTLCAEYLWKSGVAVLCVAGLLVWCMLDWLGAVHGRWHARGSGVRARCCDASNTQRTTTEHNNKMLEPACGSRAQQERTHRDRHSMHQTWARARAPHRCVLLCTCVCAHASTRCI